MGPILIFALIAAAMIALGIIGVVVSYRMEKKRTEQLAHIAAEMGFTFEPEGDALAGTALAGLPLFNRGQSKKSKNVLRKAVRGSEVILLDHQYTVGSGKNQQTHKHTVAVFCPQDRDAFPDFELCPESFFHRIGSLFGYQDIDFESHPKFSKAYRLRGINEAAIRAEFTPNVLDFFEQHPDRWSVETRSNWIAVFGKGRVSPAAMQQFLIDATKVFLLFASTTQSGN